MSALTDECVEVAARLRRAGDGAAAIYTESAAMNLRVAARAMHAFWPAGRKADGRVDLSSGLISLAQPSAGTISLRPISPVVGIRCIAIGDKVDRDEPLADLPPSRRLRPDMATTLSNSDEARAFCAGPLGAALLEDALWRWTWVDEQSRRSWQTTREGARIVVAVLSQGRQPVDLGVAMTGRIDAATLDLLQRHNWKLHPAQLG